MFLNLEKVVLENFLIKSVQTDILRFICTLKKKQRMNQYSSMIQSIKLFGNLT
jgi:hypothetical protein